MIEHPALIAHADWSSHPRKRWFCCAPKVGGTYLLEAPTLVGDSKAFIHGLERRAGRGASVFVGFDFPIGVPEAFARATQIERFREELLRFGTGRWKHFYDLAKTGREISLLRPFYPKTPGGTSRTQLVERLEMQSFDELLRRCDRAWNGRSNACALFWTLGGNQVGRAAISGWRDVLAPVLGSSSTRALLWPFDGELSELLAASQLVMAETYPAEACRVIGLPFPGRGWSKRNRVDRRTHAEPILAWCDRNHVRYTEQLRHELQDGFTDHSSGEDRFDALLGLIAMIAAATGLHPAAVPGTREVRQVEGWILGQPADAGAG